MGAMTASDDLRAVCDDYWEARLQASPLYASFLGDHRFDDQADDLSAGAAQGHRTTWTTLRARVEAIPTTDFDDTDAATHQLLAQELDEAVRTIDLRLVELASDQMEGPHVDRSMQIGGPCCHRRVPLSSGNHVKCERSLPEIPQCGESQQPRFSTEIKTSSPHSRTRARA